MPLPPMRMSATQVSLPPIRAAEDYAPDPNRRVMLVTAVRSNPWEKIVRDIGRGQRTKEVTHDVRKRDDLRDRVYALGRHTDEFNDILQKAPRDDGRIVSLVIERMKKEGVKMTVDTFNLLLQRAADVRGELCFEVYADMRQSAINPTVATLQHLLRACERNGQYERAFRFYTHMRQAGLQIPVGMYNTLITYAAFARDEAQASYFLEEMKDQCVDPDIYTYNALLNVFREAPYSVLMALFEDLQRRNLVPNRRTYNTLMRACQQAKDYEQCFKLFEEMKKAQITPDVVTYNILLVLCHERLDYIRGVGAYASVKRTAEQIDVGFKALAELCMALLAEMQAINVPPNTFTFESLLSTLGACGDVRVYNVFAEMKRCAAEGPRPTGRLTYEWAVETVPSRQAQLERPPESSLLDDVGGAQGGRGVSITQDTYLLMIDACGRLQHYDKAFALFEEVVASQRPSKAAFLAILDICARKGEKGKAYAYLSDARAAMPLDIELLNALFNVLAECADDQLLTELESLETNRGGYNLKPNVHTYNAVLRGCVKLRSLTHAMRVYRTVRETVGPNEETYMAMMDVCAVNRNVTLAASLLAEMADHNLTPTMRVYCRLMAVYVACRDSTIVSLFERLKRTGPQPNVEAYKILLSYYAERDEQAAVALFDDMKATGMDPDLDCYNVLLESCVPSGNTSRCLRYFEELKTRGFIANVSTYNALLRVLAPTGSEFVYKIFEEMRQFRIAPDQMTFSTLMRHKAGRGCLKVAAAEGKMYLNPASE